MSNQSLLVIGQQWEESERGVAIRPDGFSLHLTMKDCAHFRTEFLALQRRQKGEAVPPEYSRASGEPFLIPVSREVYTRLSEATTRAGIWGEGPIARPDNLAGESIIRSVFCDPLVVKACEIAEEGFRGKFRKVPKGVTEPPAPYINHLHAVAGCLAEFGYSPTVIAAGYLHDHLEDLPKEWNMSRLMAWFGNEVAFLVNFVTQQDKRLSWEERNVLYEERLHLAPREAVAISVADKISNIGDLLYWMRQGYSIESVLKRGWKDNTGKMHNLEPLFRASVPPAMFARFQSLLEEFDRLGNPDGPPRKGRQQSGYPGNGVEQGGRPNV